MTVSAPATLRTAEGGFEGWCENISTGGLAISARSAPAVGSLVQVELELPSAGQVATPAQVVRREGDAVGLRFLRLDQRSLLAVFAYTTRR